MDESQVSSQCKCTLLPSRVSLWLQFLVLETLFRLFQYWAAAVGRTDAAKKRLTVPLKWEVFSLMLFNQPAAAAAARWRKASTPDHIDAKNSRKSSTCLESKFKRCIAASMWPALSRMSFIFVSFGRTSCRLGFDGCVRNTLQLQNVFLMAWSGSDTRQSTAREIC